MSTLAAPDALALTLAWLALGYWLILHPVGDDVGAQLDALQVPEVGSEPAADRYARFSRRDYSGDRGPCPVARPRYASLYDEMVARTGLDPLGGRRGRPGQAS